MNNTQKCFELTTLAAALMIAFGSAVAADEDIPAPLDRPVSTVSAGIGYWDNDRPQFGIFDGMRDEGAYLLLDANINKRDDATGTWKTLEIQDMGTNAREIRGEYLRQGDFGVTLEYNQIPRVAPYTINTNLIGIGTEEQVVGDNILTGALTGTNVQLETERKKLGLGFYKNLQAFMPGVEVKVNFSNEKKEGNRHWSRGGAAQFAAEPIDYTTNQMDATLNFAGKALQLSGGYVGNWFKNDNDLVCSRTATQTCWDSTAPFYLSLPFDNEAHQAFLSGAYRFSPTTQGTFKMSYTRATVDEAIPTASLLGGTFDYDNAPSNFDGEVNTTLVQLGLTARPMSKLSVLANVRYHDVDDQTPRYDLVGNNTTLVVSGHSTPLSYTTTSGKLEGTYALPLGYSVTAGIDYSDQDRTVPVGTISGTPLRDTERYVPFRAELEEITYRIQLRKSLSETLNGSIAYLRSDRDGSDFSVARSASVDEIAPPHIADRERDKIRLTADWAPTDALGVQLNIETSKDEYGMSAARPHGVHEGKANLYALDVSYRLSENWKTSAWVSYDNNEIYQTGRGPGGTGIKDALQKDKGNAVGLNLAGMLNPKTRLGADVSRVKEESSIVQAWDSGAVTQVPDITSTAIRVKLFAEYALRKNSDIRVDLIHERWESDDWTWQFSDGSNFQYGTTTDGTTVIVDPKQNASFVGVRYSYNFQ
jgi:MtrB/PioB family decaheme-associated outer membrane protein